jgi:integrase
MRGQGRIFKRGGTWWLDYSVDGQRHRESSGTTSQRDALDKLRQLIGDRRAGKLAGRPDRVVLAEYAKDAEGKDKLVGGLRALAETQYDLDGRRSKERLVQYWDHLEAFFGAAARVTTISGVRLDAYAAARLAAGAARQTVNNELSALRRGFRLGITKGLLAVGPTFTLPKVHNARAGFVEDGDFAALLLELPADVRDLVQFLRATGWRRDEARLLTWAAVDRDEGTIRLESARSKSGTARVFPFGLAPELVTLLARRYDVREGLYVFHRAGQPLGIGAVRSAWKRATTRAGITGRLVHDLRRSAAREFRKAGVSEGVVMRLCGWETRSMFDRYNIIDAADLDAAVAKRFNGTVKAQSAPSTASPDSLTSAPSIT